MTTHLTSWSSKMSFQRGKKSGSRSNSPLNNSPSLSTRSQTGLLRTQSHATTVTTTMPNTTLSLTEKDFAEKGKQILHK